MECITHDSEVIVEPGGVWRCVAQYETGDDRGCEVDLTQRPALVDVNDTPWPLMSDEGIWVALDGSLTKREAVAQLADLLEWWIHDNTTYREEDGVLVGWLKLYRQMWTTLEKGAVRKDAEMNYWWECQKGEPGVPAWIFNLL